MPLPDNRNQLELLTSAQVAELEALGAVKVAEMVKISWPSPDGAKVYSWWNALADSAYTTPLTNWLDGAPLVPGFVASDTRQRFHNIPRTSAIGDDVVQMRVSNYGQVFETLCYKWRGGVKVEIFYFFPDLNSGAGLAISWFLGHLRKADSADADFVHVTVRNGFRSPYLIIPSRVNGSTCQWYFNGEHDPGIPDNPCDYDRHLGGTRGNLDGATPFTFCDHTQADCLEILGDLESYGGDDHVTESSLIGAGDHKTISRTVGNESRLIDPIRVVYGTRHVRSLQLARYAKEYNPSEEDQDAGTIRTVFKVSEGPIEAITNVKVMDRDLPREDGLGLETRLGTQRQSPTTFSANMLNLNRTAHFRGDLNPIDPNGVQATDIVAECDVEGRNTINIYDAEGDYTQALTNNRADCLVDLLTNNHYGYRMDVSRLNLDDIVYLRSLNSPFDCDVQGRSVQQQVTDICLAGRWYLPFHYDGLIRILPIEDIDLTADDIPVFTDVLGPSCNILWDRQRSVSRLTVSYRDSDDIPNAVILTIEDADAQNIERPLTFDAWQEQYKDGLRWGDTTKRRDPKPYAAYGLTHVDDVKPLGEMLVRFGPFGTGGISNNCAVDFWIDAVSGEALNLHENKVIRVDSAKLDPYIDEDGNPFQYFLITSLYRNANLELNVKAQAYKNAATCITSAVDLDLCPDHDPPEPPYNAVEFDFLSSHYELLPGLNLPDFPNTLCFWAYLDHMSGFEENYLIHWFNPGGEVLDLYVSGSTGKLTFVGTSTVAGDTVLSTGQWYHIAIVAAAGSGAARTVYLNGVEEIATTGNAPTPSSIYFTNYPLGRPWYGRMAAVKCWEAALTEEEIQTEMGAYGPCRTTDWFGWWPMKDAATGTVDYGPNCLNLTQEGSTIDADGPPGINFYCATETTGTTFSSGYVRWTTPDDDVIDGPNGINTRILAVSETRDGFGYIYPESTDPDAILISRWTHTIVQMPAADSYNVTHPASALGFKVWFNGQGWIYYEGGIDIDTFPEGTIQQGDTLTVEYDENSGSPVRRYKHNGVTVRTDTTDITPIRLVGGVAIQTGDLIGDVFWELEVEGCASDFAVETVSQSGTSQTLPDGIVTVNGVSVTEDGEFVTQT